jgi:hypothetical protein
LEQLSEKTGFETGKVARIKRCYLLIKSSRPVMVVYNGNPSYSGDGGSRIVVHS